MRMRTIATLAGVLAAALWAAPAQAKLVYVKQAGTVDSAVYVARDGGEDERRLGLGRAPTIAPNGRWVAYVAARAGGSQKDTVVLQKLRSGSQRLVMRSDSVDTLRFSPDSTRLATIADRKRVRLYDIADGTLRTAARGHIRGYSFSPDSQRLVFGDARSAGSEARSDLFIAPVDGGAQPQRLTSVRNAINPVWGAEEIVFDRFERRPDAMPAFDLWAVAPGAGDRLRRLTRLTLPPLASGLVPLEISADARRMLAVFTGQDTELGFTVATRSGRTRALSTDFESGVVGFDLSSDGSTILAHTGGADPQAAHNVVAVPYGGEREPEVLVEGAAYPDWTR